MTPLEQLAVSLVDEPGHVLHVRRLALELFDATRPLHGLDASARRLLEAAALLHDIGWRVSPERHHKASRDRILGLELPGFDEAARRMTACIARYHRGSDPDPSHKVYHDLDVEQRTVVRRLAAVLRLADGLDRSHQFATTLAEIHCDSNTLHIRLRQRTACPEDLEGALKKSGLFERVFALTITIEIVP